MSELKPCPFCGGNVLTCDQDEDTGDFFVGCACGVQGPPSSSDIEADAEWNCRRPEPPAPRAGG
jgi:hypothetical protein